MERNFCIRHIVSQKSIIKNIIISYGFGWKMLLTESQVTFWGLHQERRNIQQAKKFHTGRRQCSCACVKEQGGGRERKGLRKWRVPEVFWAGAVLEYFITYLWRRWHEVAPVSLYNNAHKVRVRLGSHWALMPQKVTRRIDGPKWALSFMQSMWFFYLKVDNTRSQVSSVVCLSSSDQA